MNNKGQAYAAAFISATLGVLLLTSVFIPIVKTSTDAVTGSDTLVYTFNDTVNASFTLSQDDLTSITISGLTLSTNYTQSLSAGTVTILANTTATDNYTAAWVYHPSTYLEDSSHRALAAVLVIAGIIGILYAMFVMFGLV